jgi:uncharacterized protein
MRLYSNKQYLGCGLTFPLTTDGRGLLLAEPEQDIEQAIRIILGTIPNERIMRPEFGCRIHELVFAPFNGTTEALAILYVEEALERWEPRVEVREVDVAQHPQLESAMLIDIRYRIKDTYDERSLVYPLYLAAEGELSAG